MIKVNIHVLLTKRVNLLITYVDQKYSTLNHRFILYIFTPTKQKKMSTNMNAVENMAKS